MIIHYLKNSLVEIKKASALMFLIMLSVSAWAQQANRQLTGTVLSQDGQSVRGASVKIVSAQDSMMTGTDEVGMFNFRNLKGTQFKLTVTSLGFDTLVTDFTFDAERTQMLLPAVTLNPASVMIDAVSITGRIDLVVKEDTLEFNTKDLKLRDGSLAEDALKKLDGVEVDKDGNVTAQGESVTRIRINGKDFFGGDLKAATRNLPADIIEKIQIIDDYGDMANITGNRTGDPERIINIQIDPSRNNGSMGNFRVGGGTEERYQATAMYGIMRNNMNLSFLGNLNNVNASLFDFNIRGSGARRGPGGGGGGRGGFGGGGGFGGANGLTNTGSIGVNYRHDYNEALTMYGNYSYSQDKNTTLSYRINDYFNEKLVEANDNTSGSRNNSHRFDWNVEYKPTTVDYFKISPSFSLRDTRNDGLILANNTLDGVLINNQTTNTNSSNFSPNYGISGLYNRRLNDNGRNLFFDYSFNSSSTEQDDERVLETALLNSGTTVDSYIRTLADLKNMSLNGGASVSYTEPLSQFGSLEIQYDFNFRNYDNRRSDDARDASGQPIINDDIYIGNRVFDYSFITHRGNLNYRYRSEKIIYSIGASVQPTLLKGDATIDNQVVQVNRTGLNFAPIARFEYKFSRTKSFNIRYNGRSNEPSFSQLQPFTDYSNRNNPVTGNPNLDAEFNHDLRISFNNFDPGSGQSWMIGMSGNITEDKIVTNRTIRRDETLGIIQETSYLNADGFKSARAWYNYSLPFKNKTYVVSYGGFANFSDNISFSDDVKNIGTNFLIAQNLSFRYNPSEKLEIQPSVRYSYNSTQNSNTARANVNNNISSWSYVLTSSFNITPSTIISTDITKTTNSGYTSSVDANPFIINAYIEQQFFKGNRGSIRLQAFDILNEQTNISRNVSDNLITDSRTNRLARYFMLSFSYRFQNFAGGSMDGMNQRDGNRGPGGTGGRGMQRF